MYFFLTKASKHGFEGAATPNSASKPPLSSGWMVIHLSQSYNVLDMYQLTKLSDVDYTEALL